MQLSAFVSSTTGYNVNPDVPQQEGEHIPWPIPLGASAKIGGKSLATCADTPLIDTH